MNHKLEELNLKLKSLAIFRNLLNQPILLRLQHLLSKSQENKIDESIDALASFASEIYQYDGNLSKLIFTIVMEDENPYIQCKSRGMVIDENLENALSNELTVLQEISVLTLDDFSDNFRQYLVILPSWKVEKFDFHLEYQKRMEHIMQYGYGIYAKYHMFSLQNDKIMPIKYPDSQKLSEFSNYERERNLIIKNTQVLLSGGKASNTLLYGDAGTGKSSTIKAIVNEYYKDGLRLVEVKKQQLFLIPNIIDELSKNPLKFIIFIDDLSFASNDENFAALKSILEGGVSSIGNNVVIYATSNRKHLLKEDHQSRLGEEVHLNDTLQETMSLSSRFGLTITFNRPEKDVYLNIITALAMQNSITMEKNELFVKAEAYAIRHHGRSPRTAKQFIELLKAGI